MNLVKRFSKALIISITLLFVNGCAHTYTISVVDNNNPVPNADYHWHLARKCRTGLDGKGQTDSEGIATFKSYPNAYVYVIKDDKWGSALLTKDIKVYLIELEHVDKIPMDVTAKIMFGIELESEEIPQRGDY